MYFRFYIEFPKIPKTLSNNNASNTIYNNIPISHADNPTNLQHIHPLLSVNIYPSTLLIFQHIYPLYIIDSELP